MSTETSFSVVVSGSDTSVYRSLISRMQSAGIDEAGNVKYLMVLSEGLIVPSGYRDGVGGIGVSEEDSHVTLGSRER